MTLPYMVSQYCIVTDRVPEIIQKLGLLNVFDDFSKNLQCLVRRLAYILHFGKSSNMAKKNTIYIFLETETHVLGTRVIHH